MNTDERWSGTDQWSRSATLDQGLVSPEVTRSGPQNRSRRVWILPVVWVLLLSWIAFFHRLGDIGLLDETEPLFVEAARQMAVTGDWITPQFNGLPRFDKPPLIYWLMVGAFRVFGLSEWAARLPSALAGTALVGLVFYALAQVGRRDQLPVQLAAGPEPTASLQQRWAQRLWADAWGLLPYIGSAILALNLQMAFFGRTGYSDMLLNACFSGALLTFLLGYWAGGKSRWYWVTYGLIGLGVLTKGPVALVLPVAIIGIFLLSTGQLRHTLPRLRLLPGFCLALGIALPWYGLAYLQNGSAFWDSFWGFHNFGRFTRVVNQHSGPWYYHFLILIPAMLPWSVALPAAIWRVVRQRSWAVQSANRAQQLGLFALIWFGGVMGFFAISATKYMTYSLPAVPAAALLLALWWDGADRGAARKPWATAMATCGIFIALAVGIFLCPQWLNDDPSMPNLGRWLQSSQLTILGAVIWAGCALEALLLFWQRRPQQLWRIIAVGYAAFVLLILTPVLTILDGERQLPVRQMAQDIRQIRRSGEPVVMALDQFEKPSIVFYTQQPMPMLNRSRFVLPYLKGMQGHPSPTVLMMTTQSMLLEAELPPNRYQSLTRHGPYLLIRVPLR
jgi:4-amino-4-deoxy-L-arabinose transferase-like glycosyltransferase